MAFIEDLLKCKTKHTETLARHNAALLNTISSAQNDQKKYLVRAGLTPQWVWCFREITPKPFPNIETLYRVSFQQDHASLTLHVALLTLASFFIYFRLEYRIQLSGPNSCNVFSFYVFHSCSRAYIWGVRGSWPLELCRRVRVCFDPLKCHILLLRSALSLVAPSIVIGPVCLFVCLFVGLLPP